MNHYIDTVVEKERIVGLRKFYLFLRMDQTTLTAAALGAEWTTAIATHPVPLGSIEKILCDVQGRAECVEYVAISLLNDEILKWSCHNLETYASEPLIWNIINRALTGSEPEGGEKKVVSALPKAAAETVLKAVTLSCDAGLGTKSEISNVLTSMFLERKVNFRPNFLAFAKVANVVFTSLKKGSNVVEDEPSIALLHTMFAILNNLVYEQANKKKTFTTFVDHLLGPIMSLIPNIEGVQKLKKILGEVITNALFSRSHLSSYPSSFHVVDHFVKENALVAQPNSTDQTKGKASKKRKRVTSSYVSSLLQKVYCDGFAWRNSSLFKLFLQEWKRTKETKENQTNLKRPGNGNLAAEISIEFRFFVELYNAAYFQYLECIPNAEERLSAQYRAHESQNELLEAMRESGAYLYGEQNFAKPQFEILKRFFAQHHKSYLSMSSPHSFTLTEKNVEMEFLLYSTFLNINHGLVEDSLVEIFVCGQTRCDRMGTKVVPFCLGFLVSVLKLYGKLRDLSCGFNLFFDITRKCSASAQSSSLFLFTQGQFRLSLGQVMSSCLPAQIPALWKLCQNEYLKGEDDLETKCAVTLLVSVIMHEMCSFAVVADHNAVLLNELACSFRDDLLLPRLNSPKNDLPIDMLLSILDSVMYLSDRCQRYLPIQSTILTGENDLNRFTGKKWVDLFAAIAGKMNGSSELDESTSLEARSRFAVRAIGGLNRAAMLIPASMKNGRQYEECVDQLHELATGIVKQFCSGSKIPTGSTTLPTAYKILFDNILLISRYASSAAIEKFANWWISFLVNQADKASTQTCTVVSDAFESQQVRGFTLKILCTRVNEFVKNKAKRFAKSSVAEREQQIAVLKLAASMPWEYWTVDSIQKMCKASIKILNHPLLHEDASLTIITLRLLLNLLEASPSTVLQSTSPVKLITVFQAHYRFPESCDPNDLQHGTFLAKLFASKFLSQLLKRMSTDDEELEFAKEYFSTMFAPLVSSYESMMTSNDGVTVETLLLILGTSNEIILGEVSKVSREKRDDSSSDGASARGKKEEGLKIKCYQIGKTIERLDAALANQLSDVFCNDTKSDADNLNDAFRLVACVLKFYNVASTVVDSESPALKCLPFLPNLLKVVVSSAQILKVQSTCSFLLSVTKTLPRYRTVSNETYSSILLACFRAYHCLKESANVQDQFLYDTVRNCGRAAVSEQRFDQLMALLRKTLLENRHVEKVSTAVVSAKSMAVLFETLSEEWHWQYISTHLVDLIGELGDFASYCGRNNQFFEYFETVFNVFKIVVNRTKHMPLTTSHVSSMFSVLGMSIHSWKHFLNEASLDANTAGKFTLFVQSMYSLIMSTLQYRSRAVYACCGQLVTILGDLTDVIFNFFENNSTSDGGIHPDFLSCVRCLRRLYEEISHHAAVFKHFAPYIVAHVLRQMKLYGLRIWNKQEIKEGIFFIFSICTDHETRQIFATHDAVGRSFFESFYDQYKRSKFTGL